MSNFDILWTSSYIIKSFLLCIIHVVCLQQRHPMLCNDVNYRVQSLEPWYHQLRKKLMREKAQVASKQLDNFLPTVNSCRLENHYMHKWSIGYLPKLFYMKRISAPFYWVGPFDSVTFSWVLMKSNNVTRPCIYYEILIVLCVPCFDLINLAISKGCICWKCWWIVMIWLSCEWNVYLSPLFNYTALLCGSLLFHYSRLQIYIKNKLCSPNLS